MKVSRRGFLGAAGDSTLGGGVSLFGVPKSVKAAEIPEIKTVQTTESDMDSDASTHSIVSDACPASKRIV